MCLCLCLCLCLRVCPLALPRSPELPRLADLIQPLAGTAFADVAVCLDPKHPVRIFPKVTNSGLSTAGLRGALRLSNNKLKTVEATATVIPAAATVALHVIVKEVKDNDSGVIVVPRPQSKSADSMIV